MNLMPLLTRLETLRMGRKGEDLFVHMLPPGKTEAVLLRNPLKGTKINYDLPGYFKTDFTLIVRSADFETGNTRMQQIMDAITLADEQVGDQFFNYCRPCFLPVAFPMSDASLIEHTVQMDVCYVQQ